MAMPANSSTARTVVGTVLALAAVLVIVAAHQLGVFGARTVHHHSAHVTGQHSHTAGAHGSSGPGTSTPAAGVQAAGTASTVQPGVQLGTQPPPRPTAPQLPVPEPKPCLGLPAPLIVDGKPCQLSKSAHDVNNCFGPLPPDALHVVDVNPDTQCGGFYGGESNPQGPLYLRPKSSDVPVFRAVWIENEFGFLDKLFVRAGMPHGPATILDLGMNCGVAALYMSLRYPQAQIVSVEPSVTTFSVASLNLVHRPRAFRELGAAEGQGGGYAAILDRHQGAWAFGVTRVTGDERKVATFGVFDVGYIMRKYGWDRIDYLKVDIEGSEDSVCDAILDGSAQWIKAVRCVTMEPHDRYVAGITNKCQKAMRESGLQLVQYIGELIVWCRPADQP